MPKLRERESISRGDDCPVTDMTDAEIRKEMEALNEINAERRGTRWVTSEEGWDAFERFTDLLREQTKRKKGT